jgi:hypothetical protein
MIANRFRFLSAALAVCASLALQAVAQPYNGLWYQSTPGDPVGHGQTALLAPPAWTVGGSHSAGTSVSFTVLGGGGSYFLHLASALGAPLAPGAYEEAARHAFSGASPGLDFSGMGTGCNAVFGRFAVLEAEYGPGNTLVRFAANFEQWCNGAPPLFGEVRFNSNVGFTVNEPAGDTTPDPFRFYALGPQREGSYDYSNFIRLYGVNAPVPLSIIGGEYSVNGGAFTSTPTTAQPLDMVQVRIRHPRIVGGAWGATLQAGGQSAHYIVQTYHPEALHTVLHFDSPAGDPLGHGQQRSFFAPPNAITATRNPSNGVAVQVIGIGGSAWTLQVSAPGSALLAPGTYEGATRYPINSGTPGLSLSGEGRACNTLTGRFVVWEIGYGAGDEIVRFAADFQQSCEGGAPLYGQVRFNSTVPVSHLVTPRGVNMKGGDFNGDGRADLLWRHSDGSYGVWLMDGIQLMASGRIFYGGSGLEILLVGDFNGDGKSDLLGRYPDGRVRLWFMDGVSAWAAVDVLGPGTGWTPVHVGDFDNDGKSDLLWMHMNGAYGIWLMNGFAPKQAGAILYDGNGYDIRLVADLNGDGNADLVGVHADGHVRAWLMRGMEGIMAFDLAPADSGIFPVLAGDFDGDGKQDLVLRDVNGLHYTYLVTHGILNPIGTVSRTFSGVAARDLDGDNHDDILWTDLGGNAWATLIHNGVPTSTVKLLEAGTGLRITTVNDHDGNGRSDIVWRHADGSVQLWMMNGTSATNVEALLGPGTGWSVSP